MEQRKLYEDIALRTEGDIYIGVVGPVRTGKSTFIKRFMETMVIPNIDNVYRKERARDELPQSGSGRTVMTAEPKFVPEEAVRIDMENGASFSVRLIDCVGYLVPGAAGAMEDDSPRMVTTPWFDYEIPMTEAAEIGTRKVIAEHSTIGIVVTTDGTITDIPREDYLEAEERVIQELKELGKPFLVVLNSAYPESDRAKAIRADLASRYDVTVVCADCLQLDEEAVTRIIKGVLYEFPVKELDLFLPPWVDALPYDHPIKNSLYTAIREGAAGMRRIRDVEKTVSAISGCDCVSSAVITSISLGTGLSAARLDLPRELFYDTLSQQSGFTVHDDGDLLELLSQLSHVKSEYDKVAGALEEVKATGYGIVVPSTDELVLEEPEIVKQGGRYGVRLKASAPSIHMIRADIETEVSPIVGNEKQSEEMVNFLLQEFEGDTKAIWQSSTMAIDAMFKQMKADGIDVIGFGAGEPDFNTPDNIKQAGIEAIEHNVTRYTPSAGTVELRQAVCDRMKADCGLDYKPGQVVVSSGAKHLVYLALRAMVNPGDEVILPAPYWVSYIELIRMVGGIPVVVTATEAEHFKISAEKLEAAITPKTKAMILNNPSNPTGMMYSREELEAIAAVCLKHEIYVISDEIYACLAYDGKKSTSFAALSPEIKELTVLVSGVSKAYAMTGWRIGYACANETIAKIMANYVSHSTGSPVAICQKAAVEALTSPQDQVETMRQAFEERRNYIVERMNSIPGVSCIKPEGAFYVMMNLEQLIGKTIHGVKITDDDVFADALLKYGLVAVVPGSGFGAPNFVRWSYATSMENIKEGLNRLEKFLAE